jgi:hypothetical protein
MAMDDGRVSFDALGPIMGGNNGGRSGPPPPKPPTSLAQALPSEIPDSVRDILLSMKSGEGGSPHDSHPQQEESAFLNFVQACRRRTEDGSLSI